MYLKNTSTNTAAIVNTKVGKVCIRPGEVVCLNEKVFSPLAPSLRQATEEEYLSFRQQKENGNKVVQTKTEQPVGTDNESNGKDDNVEKRIETTDLKLKAMDTLKSELSTENELTAEDINTAIDKVAEEIKDPGTVDFIKSLFKFNLMGDTNVVVNDSQTFEVEEETEEEHEEKDALKLEKTTNEIQKELLEQQIADLKVSWQKAKQPKRKEKIYKEIQELQKQVDKL